MGLGTEQICDAFNHRLALFRAVCCTHVNLIVYEQSEHFILLAHLSPYIQQFRNWKPDSWITLLEKCHLQLGMIYCSTLWYDVPPGTDCVRLKAILAGSSTPIFHPASEPRVKRLTTANVHDAFNFLIFALDGRAIGISVFASVLSTGNWWQPGDMS